MTRMVFTLIAALALSACRQDVAAVVPAAMTDEALGHYCQMFVADHPGPKAQVHLKGHSEPLWFSQVSDAVAYLHDPEREAEITGIFVSDMSRAESWEIPGQDNWVPAETASLVLDSDRPGGMGVPEAIPFGTREAASRFVKEHGGQIAVWNEVPESYVRPEIGGIGEPSVHGENHE